MRSMHNAWWRTVRFGFRLLYNEMAFTYDTVSKAVSLGAWRSWQRTTLNFLPPHIESPILEIAHGTGDLQIDLHNAGYRTVGYDLSPYMGRITSRKMHKRGIDPVLVRGMGQKLPFASSCFSAIVCTFPTRFIFMDETLSEIQRVLTPGGRLIIVLHGRLTTKNVVKKTIDWLYRVTGQGGGDDYDMMALEPILPQFRVHGLRAEWQTVTCEKSEALLIVAEKIAMESG